MSAAEPRPAQFIPGLTAARGIAAVSVVLIHAWAIANNPDQTKRGVFDLLGAGYLAVDVFFVLSGFVLFLPMVRREGRPGSYGKFLTRRVTRLWPCYALLVTLGVVLHSAAAPGPLLPAGSHPWQPFLAHALMLPTFTGLDYLGFGNNPVLWTITIETTFSLLMPLFARWWFRHPVLGLVLAATVSRGWIYACTHIGPGSTMSALHSRATTPWAKGAAYILELPTYAVHFGLGMTLAWVYVRHGETLRARFRGVDVLLAGIGLTGTLGVAVVLTRSDELRGGGYGTWTASWPILFPLCALLTGILLAEGRFARILASRGLVLLGDVSYPLYLTHFFVMRTVTFRLGLNGWPDFAANMATVPFSLAVAALLHRYVEMPCYEWGRRRTRLRVHSPAPQLVAHRVTP